MSFLLNIIFKGNGLIIWIQNKLAPKQFIIFSAILIGLTAGLAAVLLKLFVHWFTLHLGNFSSGNQFIISVFPIIGISLCAIYVYYLNRNKLGKGLSNILFAIAKKSSILPKDQTYSHIITSAFTVALGGSAGLESPIVTTGSAIGSNFGLAYKLSYKERTLLLACGAAAGIAGAFIVGRDEPRASSGGGFALCDAFIRKMKIILFEWRCGGWGGPARRRFFGNRFGEIRDPGPNRII